MHAKIFLLFTVIRLDDDDPTKVLYLKWKFSWKF